MKILKVSKEKNFFKVEFDTGEFVAVSEDLMVQFRLIKDKEITLEQYQELKVKAGYDRGLQQALNYISFQLRSEKEVDRYLKKKEFESIDRSKIIDRLKELRVIDDVFYAESFVRTQLALSDKGPKQIQRKLQERGIGEEALGKALALYTQEDEEKLATQTAQKLANKIRHKSHRERLQKIRMGLIQKGYQVIVVDRVMNAIELEQNQEEEQFALEKAGQIFIRKNQRLPLAKRKQKVKQGLYNKGFELERIQEFIDRECIDETE